MILINYFERILWLFCVFLADGFPLQHVSQAERLRGQSNTNSAHQVHVELTSIIGMRYGVWYDR